MQNTKDELAAIFRALGAQSPDELAHSQIEEGIPQLHRYVFLRQSWAQIADEADDSWIERVIEAARRAPDAPFSGQGFAMERMLAAGVARADIVDLVRASQAEMLFGLCYLLEDPALEAEVQDRVGDLGWALVTTDDEYEPTAETIGGLHESVLALDPTGREMRPRRKSS